MSSLTSFSCCFYEIPCTSWFIKWVGQSVEMIAGCSVIILNVSLYAWDRNSNCPGGVLGWSPRLIEEVTTSSTVTTHAKKREAEVATHYVVEDRVDGSAAVVEQPCRVVYQSLPPGHNFANVHHLFPNHFFCCQIEIWIGNWCIARWLIQIPVTCEQTLHVEWRPTD